jgi:hypothetical protein
MNSIVKALLKTLVGFATEKDQHLTGLREALENTARAFPHLEGLEDTLRRWISQDKVHSVLNGYTKGGSLDLAISFEDLQAALDSDNVGFYAPNLTDNDKAHILRTFFNNLRQAYLKTNPAFSIIAAENRAATGICQIELAPEARERATPLSPALQDPHIPVRSNQSIRQSAPMLARMPVTPPLVIRRDKEIGVLHRAWADRGTRILVIESFGGNGKTSLANAWLSQIENTSYNEAERVFAWSFDGQSSTGEPNSSDLFIDSALRWFGDAEPSAGTPWGKGERLAMAISTQRTLLILDGLEAVQDPTGNILDYALNSLLRSLVSHNLGLVVITTRRAIPDLSKLEGRGAHTLSLQPVEPREGARYLRTIGVRGDLKALERVSAECAGNPLRLTLIGNYLLAVFDGRIEEQYKIADLSSLSDYEQLSAIMSRYCEWLSDEPGQQILFLLSAFEDSVTLTELRQAAKGPVLPNLTDKLMTASFEHWQFAIAKLRAMKLIAPAGEHPDRLDYHPMIRDYLRKYCRDNMPSEWRELNARLFDLYLLRPFNGTRSPESMLPYFAAVKHGCEAQLLGVHSTRHIWANYLTVI